MVIPHTQTKKACRGLVGFC